MDLNGLAKRVEVVERRCRRLKALLAVVLLGGGAVLVGLTAQDAEIVHARQLILEDSGGRTRATLAVDEHGASLRFLGEDGTVRAVAGMQEEGPAFALHDAHGEKTAELIEEDSPEGWRALSIYSRGQEMMTVGLCPAAVGLWLMDAQGLRRVAFGLGENGPSLGMYDAQNRVIFEQPDSGR